MTFLIVGGLGYVGSHTVAYLLERNYSVVVIDNLSKGHREAMSSFAALAKQPEQISLVVGDIRDDAFLARVFTENKDISCVVHFGADSLVGESMTDPLKYYDNNVDGARHLLQAMVKHNVKNIVFSSTAAVFGTPERVPIQEDDRKAPTNCYGETKLAIERMLHWTQVAHGITFVVLRYFNAVGAHESGTLGEDHNPETHLVPIVLQVARGTREHLVIFGDDYDTRDGTCVRDYVHVSDLAEAHLKASEFLKNNPGKSETFNLGSGLGCTVKEMVACVEKVTGKKVPLVMGERRAGDPAVLIASSAKAKDVLGWECAWGMERIIQSAWAWRGWGGNSTK